MMGDNETNPKMKELILKLLKGSEGMPISEISVKIGRNYYLTLKCLDELIEEKKITRFHFRGVNYFKINDKPNEK